MSGITSFPKHHRDHAAQVLAADPDETFDFLVI